MVDWNKCEPYADGFIERDGIGVAAITPGMDGRPNVKLCDTEVSAKRYLTREARARRELEQKRVLWYFDANGNAYKPSQ